MSASIKLVAALSSAALLMSTASSAVALGLNPPRIEVPEQEDAIISGVTVLNPGVGRLEGQTIVIHDGRIVEIRPTRSTDPAPICGGCIAMPGLIDAHVHSPPRLAFGNQELFSLMYLAYGVTSVRDVGESDSSIRDMAERLNSGETVGPHMYRCGPVLDGDPPSWGAARPVLNAEEAKTAVDEIAASGADCIKVYNELGLEAYNAVREAAAAHDLPVIGHAPHHVRLENIRDFESQHFTGVPYVRGGRPALTSDFNDADFVSMTPNDIETALSLAKSQNVSFLPTLANGGRLRLIASDATRFRPTPGARFMPEIWTEYWNSTDIASHPTGDGIEQRLARIPVSESLTRRAHEMGIDILAGTDTLMPWVVPGESLQIEIGELARAMGDNEAALASATVVNGRHIANGEIGIIAMGARADILLLPSDPVENLSALQSWRILFADGRRYDRERIDAWMGRYRQHFHSPIYTFVMNWAARIAAGGRGHAHIEGGAAPPPISQPHAHEH